MRQRRQGARAGGGWPRRTVPGPEGFRGPCRSVNFDASVEGARRRLRRRMKPIALIRASLGLAVVDLLHEIGAPVESIWQRAGLPGLQKVDPGRLVPFKMMSRFLENAA